MTLRTAGALAVAAALLAPAAASAQTYPDDTPLGKPQPEPKGPARTHTVCKRGCDFTRIQAAVDAARAGDRIKVRRGTYREGVRIAGARKAHLTLTGDPRRPGRVVLDGRGLRGASAQNGVFVNGADGVTVNGFKARRFKSNGFFVTNAIGYELTNLISELSGVYGIYAFNSIGGEMTRSEAYYHNDAGFYVGQTPPQSKPVRTIVRDVKAWGNVLGFSGTNMRYVTITGSQWFNNGLGIVPNALDSEKYAPEEDNVIADNEIFWNNFNYFAGAPFKLRRGSTGSIPYPVGTGVLLFGGRGNIVERNRIYGNYLVGVGAIQQVLLKQADAKDLRNNVVRDNQFGLSGTDKNGRDLFYDGNGTGNCFAANAGVEATVPADGSTFAACPFTGANAFNPAAQQEALNWTISDPTHEKFWVKRPHPPKRGITPLEHYTEPGASAAAAQRKTVKVRDNFFSPARLTANPGTIVTWKWPREAGDVHDVKLVSGPNGVRRFQSDPASSDFSYRRRLTKQGSYRIVCTLHEDEMKMTIKVGR